jgi:putative endonuclease
MSVHTQTFGRAGERLAETYLTDLGARVLARNYRIACGEIDLLLEHEGELVAVEVKTRATVDLEQPEEAFTWRQFRRIQQALTTYAVDTDLLEMPWRIDAVAIQVDTDGSVQRLDHLRSVYPG